MDTSKDYYESVMRDFAKYGRGRTLEQYCRDEAVDYKWLVKARENYGTPEKSKITRGTKKLIPKTPDMIQLHFASETKGIDTVTETAVPTEGAPAEDTAREAGCAGSWTVSSLSLRTPSGEEIEIRTDNPSAVTELLDKLTA